MWNDFGSGLLDFGPDFDPARPLIYESGTLQSNPSFLPSFTSGDVEGVSESAETVGILCARKSHASDAAAAKSSLRNGNLTIAGRHAV